MPRVSVIIPAYDAAHFLGDAIESVLAQTYRDFEIIVVDDGSTDETAAITGRYGSTVRCIHQENAGVSAARNRGLALSRGQYIAFLDADDSWLPSKLEKQMAALEASPGSMLCHTATHIVFPDFVSRSAILDDLPGPVLHNLLLWGNAVNLSTAVCDRSLFDLAGGFDPELSQCADWDLWIRFAMLTGFVYLSEPLANYRQHESNMSRNAPLLERDSLRVLEKGFGMPGLPASLRERRTEAFARNYTVLAGTYFHAGRILDSIRCAARAVMMDVRQMGYILNYPVRLGHRLRHGRPGRAA